MTSGQGNTNSGAFSSRAMEDTKMIVQQQQQRATVNAVPMSYQMTGTVDNIDERDKNDPLCVTSYVNDMYAYFHMKEESTSVRPVYMESQPHINEKMRSILVDWLIEVHLKFKLVPDTLYLTVNLIDRYLERKEVSRAKLQLIGVSCLLLASKYEEIYPPELRDLVYICDRAYTRQDVSLLCHCLQQFSSLMIFHCLKEELPSLTCF
jgi:cyclin B